MLAAADVGGLSFGALAHAIRVAARAGQMDDARERFVLLLRRTDGLNRRWVAQTLRSLPVTPTQRHEHAQDLAQELTLLLWDQIALRDDEAWELFFQRALAFAQSHVAVTYTRREGLRADPRARQPERGLAIVFSRISNEADDKCDTGAIAGAHLTEIESFTRAELADLRSLVERLPRRERLAVVMRFWQQASEAEIAQALGVTTRAVRYTLARGYRRLGAWYAGEQETADTAAASEAPVEVDDGI
jgi:RNA polymerase sigma factor (sigma-70 family)